MKLRLLMLALSAMIASGNGKAANTEIDAAVDRGFVPNQLAAERLRSLPNLRPASPQEVESAIKRLWIANEARRMLLRKKHPEWDWKKFDGDIERRRPSEEAELRVFLSYFKNPSYTIFRFDDGEVLISGWVAFCDKTPVKVWNFRSEYLAP